MSDYTPNYGSAREMYAYGADSFHGTDSRPENRAEFDRFIAKVKAEALLEWAQFQEAALEASHHALDQDELNTTLAWIDDAKAYALRIKGEA